MVLILQDVFIFRILQLVKNYFPCETGLLLQYWSQCTKSLPKIQNAPSALTDPLVMAQTWRQWSAGGNARGEMHRGEMHTWASPALTAQHQGTQLHLAAALSSVLGHPTLWLPLGVQNLPGAAQLLSPECAVQLLHSVHHGCRTDRHSRTDRHGWQELPQAIAVWPEALIESPAGTAHTHVFQFCSNFLPLFAGHVSS